MMTRRGVTRIAVAATAVFLAVAGCQNGVRTGSLIGVLAGAGLGQAIGGSAEATLVGAAIGGAVGHLFGNEGDQPAARKERVKIREEMDYVMVNIRNNNGSISPVRLQTMGIGYVGAQGEYYDRLPTDDELRPVDGF